MKITEPVRPPEPPAGVEQEAWQAMGTKEQVRVRRRFTARPLKTSSAGRKRRAESMTDMEMKTLDE